MRFAAILLMAGCAVAWANEEQASAEPPQEPPKVAAPIEQIWDDVAGAFVPLKDAIAQAKRGNVQQVPFTREKMLQTDGMAVLTNLMNYRHNERLFIQWRDSRK
jgi:hypothetical protein